MYARNFKGPGGITTTVKLQGLECTTDRSVTIHIKNRIIK